MARDKRITFNEVAELFDQVRPRYPPELFDDLQSFCKLSESSLVLEIGAGTAIATLPLARRGYKIVALEMGAEMARVARRNLRDFPNVEVVVSAFEDWPLPEKNFDLVMSATAFHWIEPAARYRKTAQALSHRGTLAIFRYQHIAGGDRQFFAQAQKCYQRFVPGTDPDFRLPEIADYKPAHTEEMKESGLFIPEEVLTYLTEETYSRQQFIDLLSTFSDHRVLEPHQREGLLQCIGNLIDDFGGTIHKTYLTELILARKL